MPVGGVEILMQRFIRLSQWNLVEATDAFWRLYWPTKGSARLSHAGTTLEVVPGGLYLIPPHTPFTTDCRHSVSKWFIHFTIAGHVGNLRPQIMVVSPTARMLALLAATCPSQPKPRMSAGEDANRFLEIIELVTLVVQECLPQLGERPEFGPLGAKVSQILRQRPKGKVTLGELARAAGLSERKLTELVTRMTGFTPIRYRLELRLNESMTLLRTSEATIDEVARRCGFPNRYYFTRMFSKHRYMTPAAFRRSARA